MNPTAWLYFCADLFFAASLAAALGALLLTLFSCCSFFFCRRGCVRASPRTYAVNRLTRESRSACQHDPDVHARHRAACPVPSVPSGVPAARSTGRMHPDSRWWLCVVLQTLALPCLAFFFFLANRQARTRRRRRASRRTAASAAPFHGAECRTRSTSSAATAASALAASASAPSRSCRLLGRTSQSRWPARPTKVSFFSLMFIDHPGPGRAGPGRGHSATAICSGQRQCCCCLSCIVCCCCCCCWFETRKSKRGEGATVLIDGALLSFCALTTTFRACSSIAPNNARPMT